MERMIQLGDLVVILPSPSGLVDQRDRPAPADPRTAIAAT
jgi:hypothetical protein